MQSNTQGYAKTYQRIGTVGAEVGAVAYTSAHYKDDYVEGEVRADTYAKAKGEAALKADGLVCKGEAQAGVSTGAKGKVNLIGGDEGLALGGNAKACAEARALGEFRVGKKTECHADLALGPIAEAGTTFGTKSDNIGIKVSTGGAKVKAKVTTEIDKKEESLQLGYVGGANLGAGCEVSVNTKLYNPINKEIRNNLASGDALKTTIGVADVLNPHKMTSNLLGFKPQNRAEEVVSRIPVVNVAAAVGRKLKFW